jgi:signal transduction histidine kinase
VKRLYLRIYLGFLAMLAALLAASSLFWWHGPGPRRDRNLLRATSTLVEAALPAADAPAEDARQLLARLAESLRGDLALFDARGHLVASAGGPVPRPKPDERRSHWLHDRRGPAAALRLDDGRTVVARFPDREPPALAFLASLGFVGLALAAAAWPVARGVTRRLERLERRVEALGAGDLAARVDVEGQDEVARLARSFNRAAERIESLVGAQRTLLASASHELRSPLARLRVAAELAAERGQAELGAAMARDVARLDEGVEELLVASRLGLLEATGGHEDVDLLALAAEEAARAGGEARGAPVALRGDPRSLRHLLRNLLENARRHAPGAPVEIEVGRDAADALVRVLDRGPGLAPDERERVFEPFVRGDGASAHGAGLGLALVRLIARHHGGDVRWLPREGGGSAFEVRLSGRRAPAASVPNDRSPTPLSRPAPARGSP